eukprot:scaffold2882_cov434-Prasinococcus_capsulatus_cf.AAC.16
MPPACSGRGRGGGSCLAPRRAPGNPPPAHESEPQPPPAHARPAPTWRRNSLGRGGCARRRDRSRVARPGRSGRAAVASVRSGIGMRDAQATAANHALELPQPGPSQAPPADEAREASFALAQTFGGACRPSLDAS